MDTTIVKFELAQNKYCVTDILTQLGFPAALVLIVLIICFFWFLNECRKRHHEENIFKGQGPESKSCGNVYCLRFRCQRKK